MPNFLITIVIGLVSRCHLFGLCMTVRDSLALGSTRGEAVVWSWNHRRRRTTSTNDSGEFEDCSNRGEKSYADNRRRDLEFAVGDYVYLKVSPIRGLRRFKVKGKLAPRYIGPFKIIDRKGEVAYQPELHDDYRGYTISVCEYTKSELREDELNVCKMI
ncbi:LOW QUALITY PROTEIN: hypothetical protein U9M48_042993 [Paspalum notatum var. saurae]|uniref:Tf2-1-like SH3-like domain-containing protein n=1 Tax=Paspalum notatum var. saurae TaxID=547442 RepID=A0AAQ3US78_PASNO